MGAVYDSEHQPGLYLHGAAPGQVVAEQRMTERGPDAPLVRVDQRTPPGVTQLAGTERGGEVTLTQLAVVDGPELGSTRSTGSGRQILHVLEPEPAFDAQVPVGDGVVRGAGDVDDRALLHVQLEVAADTAE